MFLLTATGAQLKYESVNYNIIQNGRVVIVAVWLTLMPHCKMDLSLISHLFLCVRETDWRAVVKCGYCSGVRRGGGFQSVQTVAVFHLTSHP